jgi:microcystin-dependent protein
MASPPFNVNQALPGDTDIVAQHPSNARTFRDIVESWLLVNHDTNGNHARVDIPRSASPTSPAASVEVLYVTTTGRLKIKHNDGTEEYVGLPPGAEIYVSGALPSGFLEKDGSAVSRSTFADLFAYLGTTFGAGDGSTTFNLPNDKGLVLAGIDSGSTRLDSTTFGSTPNLNAIGGSKNTTLITANLPPYTPAGTIVSTPSQNAQSNNTSGTIPGGGGFNVPLSGAATITVASVFTGTPQGGTSTPISRIPPTRIARAVIRY